MAQECTLVFETSKPIPFTCADGTGIEKGAILKLADPYTVSLGVALNDVVGGIAAEEKVASDGKTKIGVYRSGIFKCTVSGSVTVGDPLVMDTNAAGNDLQTAAVNAEQIVGIALETATDNETILFELKPMSQQLA
jgi:hypothetical protein